MQRNLLAIPCIVALVCFCSCTKGQVSQPVSDAIVLVQPAGSDLIVAVTYSAVVDHAKAKRRLVDLARHAGWSGGNVEIKDETIKTNANFGDQKSLARQTDTTIAFHGAAFAKDGGFILQPFVQAFSDLRRIELLFFMQGQPGFVGLRDFEHPALSIHLTRDGGPYQYVIEFKDRTIAIPILPHSQVVEQPVQAAPAAAAAQPSKQPLSMAFVVAVAAGCGFVVLGALLIVGSMRGRKLERPEPHGVSRTRRT